MWFQGIRHSDNRTYLRNKLSGGVAQGLQHWRGLGVEQGHPIGHLVVDFVLRLQLCDGARETFFNLTQSEDNNNCTSLWSAFHRPSWMIQCGKWNHVAWHEPCEQTQAASAGTSFLRPHLLVVQPVPAYGPPVVAEVVLDGWICHLWTGTEEPCFSQVFFFFFFPGFWNPSPAPNKKKSRCLPLAHRSWAWSGGSLQTVWPGPAPFPGAAWGRTAGWSAPPTGCAGHFLQNTLQTY